MFRMNLFLVFYDLNINLQLDRKVNSPPTAHFRFSNVVLRNQKWKKENWQCSQNLELNLICLHAHSFFSDSLCGIPKINPVLYPNQRIVGGEETVENAWPWQVSLQQGESLDTNKNVEKCPANILLQSLHSNFTTVEKKIYDSTLSCFKWQHSIKQNNLIFNST